MLIAFCCLEEWILIYSCLKFETQTPCFILFDLIRNTSVMKNIKLNFVSWKPYELKSIWGQCSFKYWIQTFFSRREFFSSGVEFALLEHYQIQNFKSHPASRHTRPNPSLVNVQKLWKFNENVVWNIKLMIK